MSASLIDGTNQQSDAEGPLSWVVGLDLALLADLGDEALTGMLASVGVPIVEALVTHKLG